MGPQARRSRATTEAIRRASPQTQHVRIKAELPAKIGRSVKFIMKETRLAFFPGRQCHRSVQKGPPKVETRSLLVVENPPPGFLLIV